MRPPANLFYSQHQSEHIPQKGKYAPVPEFSLMAMAATTATARVFVLAAATAAFATAFATTAAALGALDRNLKQMAWQVPTISIEAYGDNEAYLDAVADSILQAGYRPKSDYLLLSLHAIPLPDIDAGDTYTEQVRRSSHAIAERLGAPSGAWSIAYQSPFEDGRRWTGPHTARVVTRLAKRTPRGGMPGLCG